MKNGGYNQTIWNAYSRAHISVLTSMQWALFTEAASYLSGDVVDCGCGTARLAPLLADQAGIKSYTGIDYAPEMVKIAEWVTARVTQKPFHIMQERIENMTACFTSAVSIHSYYTWPDTALVLTSIYQMLPTGGLFVLATPNPQMDMPKLLDEAEKELLGHPDFVEFRQLNLSLASNMAAKFVSMDTLINEVRQANFQVIECHQQHYLGGVNFLVLQK